jgi:hypothetical protein
VPACDDGRVEHLVSGEATRFHTLEELLAFMRRVLAGVPPDVRQGPRGEDATR